jgi:hypothetical protein
MGYGDARHDFKTSVRPTLVIGLGGTGGKVLGALNELVSEKLEQWSGQRGDEDLRAVVGGYLQLLGIDTTLPTREVDLSQVAFLNLGNFDVERYLDSVESSRLREVFGWFPRSINNVGHITRGAGGLRAIGRLAYKRSQEYARAAIEKCLRELGDLSLRMQTFLEKNRTLSVEEGLDVHIVSSTCGGTGAGMLLDVCYDVKDIMGERPVRIFGHLVLPEGFSREPVDMDMLRANSYVTLSEIDHFMREGNWRSVLPNGREVQERGAPFSYCYLISGRSTSGGEVPIRLQARLVSEVIFFHVVHPGGRELDEYLLNIQTQTLSRIDQEGNRCCYGSYGFHKIIIPRSLMREVEEFLSRRVLGSVVTTTLDGAPITDEDVRTEVDELLRVHGLDRTLDSEIPSGITFKRPAGEGGKGREAIWASYMQRYEREFRENAEAALSKREEELFAREGGWEKDLRRRLSRMIKSRDKGLPFAARFLRMLTERLHEQRDRVNEELEGFEKVPSVERARNQLLRLEEKERSASEVEKYQRAVAVEFLRAVGQKRLRWLREIEEVVTELREAVAEFERKAKETGNNDRFLSYDKMVRPAEAENILALCSNPLDEEDIRSFVEEQVSALRVHFHEHVLAPGAERMDDGRDEEWLDWSQFRLQIKRKIEEDGGLRAVVEQLLTSEESRITTYIREVEAVSRPLWELKDAFPREAYVRTFCELEYESEAVLEALRSAFHTTVTPVRTSPFGEVIVYQAELGAPVSALRCIEEYRESLDRMIAANELGQAYWDLSCFCADPSWAVREIFVPEREALEAFALASALKRVKRERETGGYRLDIEGMDSERAVRSRTKAFLMFLNIYLRRRLGKYQEIRDRYLREVAEKGSELLMEAISDLEREKERVANLVSRREEELSHLDMAAPRGRFERADLEDEIRVLRSDLEQVEKEIIALMRLRRRLGREQDGWQDYRGTRSERL